MPGGNGVEFYITRSHLLVVITIIEGGFRSPTVVEKLPDLTYNSPCMLLIRFCGPLGSLCLCGGGELELYENQRGLSPRLEFGVRTEQITFIGNIEG